MATLTSIHVMEVAVEVVCDRKIVDPQLTDSDRWDMAVEFLRSSGDLEPGPTMTFGSNFKQSFLATVRNLKQDRYKNRLLSVLAIGTDSLLLELKLARRKRIQGAPPDMLWQYEKDTFISVDREAIAASMLELTSGHKGLVDACCDLLHQEFIDKSTRTLEMWIFVKATYYAIICACKALEPRGKELLLLLLRAGGNVKVPYDETVELLLSEGVVVDTNPDGVLCDLKFSSLLLMSTLLYGLYVRLSHSVEASPRPPRLDHAWVIGRTIERLDRSIFERAESQNADSLASEYSIQFEMFCQTEGSFVGDVSPSELDCDTGAENERR
ncbi:hypothetical protein SELMODRAFT_440591 [Selaginella moellendorffii]|uniref:Uncharacterized protein n=1 Tax=Selaginella moellendorffii TaxID=88036 RepID=D8RCU0_SELML|nr:hypothetical protein SELMODRAFT_440591 [Selaginella moellendorffii]